MSEQPPAETDPLERLARQAGRGDRQAAGDLLRELQDTIYRFCFSQLREEHTARDATQETALRMLRTIRRYRGTSKPKTWALGIALNVCREARRKNKRLTISDQIEILHENNPDQQLTDRESIELLKASLESLGAQQRSAIVLRYFEELSVAETAEVMKCAEGTVKATVWSALRKLRSALQTKPKSVECAGPQETSAQES